MEYVVLQDQIAGVLFTFGAAAFFLILKWLNIKRYQIRLEFIHKERVIAMEKGVPLPEVSDYDNDTKRTETLLSYLRVNPRWPIGAGILLVVGGAGTLVAMLLSGDPYHHQVWSFALIPIFLGVGLWLQYFAMRSRDGR